jgi:hypothetical protein
MDLAQQDDDIEGRVVNTFDALIQAWNSFERDTVESILSRSNSSTAGGGD